MSLNKEDHRQSDLQNRILEFGLNLYAGAMIGILQVPENLEEYPNRNKISGANASRIQQLSEPEQLLSRLETSKNSVDEQGLMWSWSTALSATFIVQLISHLKHWRPSIQAATPDLLPQMPKINATMTDAAVTLPIMSIALMFESMAVANVASQYLRPIRRLLANGIFNRQVERYLDSEEGKTPPKTSLIDAMTIARTFN